MRVLHAVLTTKKMMLRDQRDDFVTQLLEVIDCNHNGEAGDRWRPAVGSCAGGEDNVDTAAYGLRGYVRVVGLCEGGGPM